MDHHPKALLKVGVFVVIGIIVIFTSIFMLGGNRTWFVKSIPIYAHFDNVQGLAEGSIVSLTGVVIGNISKITFLKDENKLKVEMKINSSYLNEITEGSSVEIRTQGALGDKFIFIIAGDRKGTPLKEGAILEVNKAGDFMGIMAEKSGEALKIFDVITETHKLIKVFNDQNRIEKILINFTEASQSLKLSAQDSQKLISEIRNESSTKIKNSVARLDNILGKIDRGEGSLGALINDSSLHDQLKSMLGATSRKKYIKSVIKSSIENE